MRKNSKKKSLKKLLIIPDVHVPFHDKKAFDLMLMVGKAFKPDYVVILGDFVDFHAVSTHNKDPRRALELKEEILEARRCLKKIENLGAAQHVFIAGNHEDRLTRYLQVKAPELFDLITIPGVLNLDLHKFKYVPYRSHHKIGKLYFTHDIGTAGRYSVFRALESYQSNIVTGHTHRFASVIEGSVKNERHGSHSFGWLGDIKQIDYMAVQKTIKDWSLGFGTAYVDFKNNGYVYVVPVPIVEYSCVVEGKIFKA